MAIKTESAIERDFLQLLKDSSLASVLRGRIYRDEMRPADAKTEDIVFKFIAGTDAQIQEGIVVVNIYVPDLKRSGGRAVKDFSRIDALQEEAIKLTDNSTHSSEYRLTTDGSMTTIPVEGIEQHMIVLRLRFRRLSD